MAAAPALKNRPGTSSLGFKTVGIHRAGIRNKPTTLQRVNRLLSLKAADSAERWKNPKAAILHSALKAAVSAVPLAGFVFDSEFLERVVQEAYPDWHARAADHPTWTASERLALSRKMLTAVQAHAEHVAGQSRHPQQNQARQWLEQMQARQKQIRLQLARDIKTQKPTARTNSFMNTQHVQRATRAIAQTAGLPRQTLFRSTLTKEHLQQFRQRKRP